MFGQQDFSTAYPPYASQLGIPFNNVQMQQPQMQQIQQPAALQPQPTRTAAGFGSKDKLSNDTSSKDPELLKSRVFMGNLNTGQCSRNDLIDLCQPYGRLKALSLLKGYAFVQYETQTEAEMAIKILNGYNLYNQKLDVRLAAIGKGSVISSSSSTGPIRRPKHDFLFGGQRIRVETTNVRNRTFSQDVCGILKEISFYNHGKEDTLICGTCRTVFVSIKQYIEHRRQKKCTFFEREVAPTVVSCFTCKEEFNESWEFIQHLIHRHSINLYRGQPESDPVTYLEKIKNKNPAETEQNGDNEPQLEKQVPAEKNLDHEKQVEEVVEKPIEPEKQAEPEKHVTPEKQPAPTVMKPVKQEIIDQPEVNEQNGNKELAKDLTSNDPAINNSPKAGESWKITESAKASESWKTSESSKMSELSNSMREAITSTLYQQSTFTTSPPIPQFSQPIPQFSQPIQFSQPQFSQPIFSQPMEYMQNPMVQTSNIYSQPIPAPQISLPQFMAQSNAVVANQGLSEEEQMRLLEEFDMDN